MKSIISFISLVTVLAFSSCSDESNKGQIPADVVSNPASATAPQDERQASLEFDNPDQDFGSIVQGSSVKKTYEFTNTGDADLIISSANGSCGCTVPTWPKAPIKPGQTGVIEVVFNSAGKKGKQTKKVYITANTTPTNNVIVMRGEVVAPE